MKRLIFSALVGLFAVGSVLALDNIEPVKGGAFYDGAAVMPRVDSAADTTVVTAYTPRYVGDFLMGKTGTSNCMWIARGLTSNDWSLTVNNGGPFGNSDILSTAAIAHTKLAAVAPGYLLVGNPASQAVAVAVSGDVSLSSNGAVAITSGAIINTDINAAAGIAHTKLATVEPNYILVGNASSQAVAVAVSGDVTLSTAGAIAIASQVITNTDIAAAANIAATKIAGTAVTFSSAYQIDGASETTNYLYTPAFIGQPLIGATGTLWIAKGLTTNDWLQVAP